MLAEEEAHPDLTAVALYGMFATILGLMWERAISQAKSIMEQ